MSSVLGRREAKQLAPFLARPDFVSPRDPGSRCRSRRHRRPGSCAPRSRAARLRSPEAPGPVATRAGPLGSIGGPSPPPGPGRGGRRRAAPDVPPDHDDDVTRPANTKNSTLPRYRRRLPALPRRHAATPASATKTTISNTCENMPNIIAGFPSAAEDRHRLAEEPDVRQARDLEVLDVTPSRVTETRTAAGRDRPREPAPSGAQIVHHQPGHRHEPQQQRHLRPFHGVVSSSGVCDPHEPQFTAGEGRRRGRRHRKEEVGPRGAVLDQTTGRSPPA